MLLAISYLPYAILSHQLCHLILCRMQRLARTANPMQHIINRTVEYSVNGSIISLIPRTRGELLLCKHAERLIVHNLTDKSAERREAGCGVHILRGDRRICSKVVHEVPRNTLRLALFSQRFLIRSMQLVGAKKWFIQQPFLLRASLHGLIAGTIASALLITLISYANKRVEDLQLIQNNERLLLLAVGLIVLGIVVALLSTQRAVSKYLKLSLDELY